jgi:hypothetical protein
MLLLRYRLRFREVGVGECRFNSLPSHNRRGRLPEENVAATAPEFLDAATLPVPA